MRFGRGDMECSTDNIKLLYVEDDVGTRGLIETLLRKKYPQVTLLVATNGAEGYSLFQEHRPDIILTDISMPFMNGIQMASEIRKSDTEAIIIAVTAYTDAEYLENAEDLKISHVMKPIQFKDFFCAIDKSIGSLQGAASLTN
jgi:YesN/AraC family two-component response regulator